MGNSNYFVSRKWGRGFWAIKDILAPKNSMKPLATLSLEIQRLIRVAFQQGTDARFCKEYEIFKNTPDGYLLIN
jgi:peptide methionine sulfoxide reductase msrA/msrB